MTNTSRKSMAGLKRAAFSMILPLAAACGTQDNPSPFEPTEPVGRVRLVNLITDAPRSVVNASLAGVVFTVNLGNGGAAPANLPAPSTATYSPVYAGNREFVLKRTADTTVVVATLGFTVGADEDRTVYAIGGAGGSAVTSAITTDLNPVPVPGETRLRVVNMSTNAGTVDVFVTAAGANLATATPQATGLAPRMASGYFTVTPGTYVIRFVPAGTAPASRAAVAVTAATATATGVPVFTSATARTIVIADAPNGTTPIRGIVLNDR